MPANPIVWLFCLNFESFGQVIVGPPSRAEKLSEFLDAAPQPFKLSTDRGFLTITGRYADVPLSIAAIGMGSSSADFFIRFIAVHYPLTWLIVTMCREARECL